MELKIEKGTFLSGLYLAQGIADRKSTMPILANVLLRTDGKDRVLLAATDLNVTVTAIGRSRTEVSVTANAAARYDAPRPSSAARMTCAGSA